MTDSREKRAAQRESARQQGSVLYAQLEARGLHRSTSLRSDPSARDLREARARIAAHDAARRDET